jgi:hypothetical protein
MGRTSMIVVLALSVTLGVLGINLRGTTRDLIDVHAGYYKYTNARNNARTGIHRYLRYVDGIPGQSGPIPLTATLDNGDYSLVVRTQGDTLWLTSTGTCADSSYTMYVKLLFTPKPFPKARGAISIAATPATITFTGQAMVDGHNYDETGTTLVGSGDLPGVTLKNPDDSSSIAAAGAGGHILGLPPISTDPNLMDPLAFMQEYIASAQYVFNTPGNVGGNYTFGSSTNPVIVVCDAGPDTSINIRFTGNITGYGILAINGNVKFSGGFNWYGLVIAYGKNNIVDFEAMGTPKIVGGVIVAGNAGATLVLKGTGTGGKVLYSSDALDKARHIGRLLYYSVVEWYE